jgi:plasmid stabilization system protein ParE
VSLRLIVRPDAEADMATGYDWYEDQREGLGKEFVEEVSTVIAMIQSEPLRFPAIFRTLRRALVHRFPYGVFFVVRSDTVIVVAVMHLARNPRRAHRRAKSDL